MADNLAGSSGTTIPTWQYVQQVISQNIDKADDAVAKAEGYLDLIAQRYLDIQNDAPLDWYVDVNIATDTPLTWSDPVVINAMPDEPDYSSDVPDEVSIPEVVVPSGITNVPTVPEWDLTLDVVPETPNLLTYSDLPTLEPLPLIDVPIPVFDVELLTTEFSFTEPTYTERVSQETQVEILRVLGGDLGIPQAYWDDMWAKASGDLAEQQVGLARNARNRGAATYWGLPGEAVLTASRAVQDEGTKKLSMIRLELAIKQAELAHDDFWKAVQFAIAYEQQWIDFHNQIATRALTAAEQLALIAIQVHNANVARYNLMLESAKLNYQVLDLEIQTILKKYEAQLRQNQAEIEQNKGIIDVYTAEIQAYSVSQNTQIQAIAEKIKWWNSTWEADVRYKTLQQEKAKVDISNYSAILSKIDSVSKAAATLLSSRTGAAEYALKNQLGILEQQKSKNASILDVARITQSAQEIEAKLQVSQIEWLGGQGNSLLQNLAQLGYSLAQALVTVSDVNLGSSYGASDSWSTSASRNAPLEW